MLIPPEEPKEKQLKQVASVDIVFILQEAEQTKSNNEDRDVGLMIGNTEFIHVISFFPLISYSQLKVGVERESRVFLALSMLRGKRELMNIFPNPQPSQ